MGAASPSKLGAIRFGVYEVDLRAGELHKHGVKVKLQEQPFQVLQILLEHPGEIVTREDLRQRIWPSDTFVDFDGGVNNAVKRLREALGDSAESPRYVETIPRKGYRFIGPLNGNGKPVAVAEEVRSNPKSPAARWGLQIGTGIGIAAAVLLLVSLGPVPTDFWRQFSSRTNVPQIRSIAVLSLKNLSGDPSQEYFADGMTEELITDLSQISALKVISHTSIDTYKKSSKSLPEIARELHVDGVVEGSVMRSGDKIRITAQLIYAPEDKNLWAKSYDRDLRDVLALQSTVASAIVDEIRVKMTPQQTARLEKRQAVNPEALDAYWKGQYYLSLLQRMELVKGQEESAKNGFHQALANFDQAIQRDPNYAPAYLGYAGAINEFAGWVDPHTDLVNRRKPALMKALALDGTLAMAHVSLGDILFQDEWNWADAEKEYKRAIELDPNSAKAHDSYANYLDSMGRLQEGLKEHELQLQLDPDLSYGDSPLTPLELRIGRMRKFAATHERAGVAEYWWRVLLLARGGRYKEAIDEWAGLLTRTGWTATAKAVRHGYEKAGYRGALRVAAQQGEIAGANHVYLPPSMMAYLYGVLGDKDHAFAWMEKAYEERDGSIATMKIALDYEPLRSDERFAEMIRRVGLPQ